MGAIIYCKATGCKYNNNGVCEKEKQITKIFLNFCGSYIPNPPVDLGLDSKDKE